MPKETEMEVKLLIEPQELSGLLASTLVTGKRIAGSEKTLNIINRYYDTPDFRLKNQGLAYRIRKTNKDYEATIKTKGQNREGFSVRGEYTVPLPGPTIITMGFDPEIDKKLRTLLAGTALRELFHIVVTRRLCLLQVTEQTVLEMAIDTGEISATQGNEPIAEVELEIKKGTKEDLFAFLTACKKQFTIIPETRSKWQRGMDLITK